MLTTHEREKARHPDEHPDCSGPWTQTAVQMKPSPNPLFAVLAVVPLVRMHRHVHVPSPCTKRARRVTANSAPLTLWVAIADRLEGLWWRSARRSRDPADAACGVTRPGTHCAGPVQSAPPAPFLLPVQRIAATSGPPDVFTGAKSHRPLNFPVLAPVGRVPHVFGR